MADYQETRITFAAVDVPDLYAIHRKVMVVTDGDKAITYAPVGMDRNHRMVVALRARPGVEMPDGLTAERHILTAGGSLQVQSGVRIVNRSHAGVYSGRRVERMPAEEEALEKWNAALAAGGFHAEDTRMVESVIGFHHQRLRQQTRLPFWAVSARLMVTDAERAAETMVRGIGRSRGLGFGMLLVIDV